ncbi:MAG TPA: GGDEF domain-containing protein [Methylophilaceae bacterium]|nr:GGDEF domain-containing protein [Methylophilaceae bacterium]
MIGIENKPQHREAHFLRHFLRRRGVPLVTLMLTLFSVVLSVLAGLVITPLFIGPIRVGTVIATIIIPGITVPPIIWLTMRILYELDLAERKLQILSVTDDLTGIYNRRHFVRAAEMALAYAKRYSENLAMILIDLDLFKNVNDNFGHQSGDQVLIEVVRRTSDCLRASDTFARYGGEEFVVLLPSTDLEGAKSLAERIRMRIGQCPVHVDGKTIPLTISAGVTILEPHDDGIDPLLQRADKALYTAKQGGRDRVEIA